MAAPCVSSMLFFYALGVAGVTPQYASYPPRELEPSLGAPCRASSLHTPCGAEPLPAHSTAAFASANEPGSESHRRSRADVGRWRNAEVMDWVESIGFHEYRPNVQQAALDGPALGRRRNITVSVAGRIDDELSPEMRCIDRWRKTILFFGRNRVENKVYSSFCGTSRISLNSF